MASMNKFSILLSILLWTQVSFSQVIVDYRGWQSPVKDQMERGTCTAFAVTAMLETEPGFPSDISEQHLYAWAKLDHYFTRPEKYNEGGYLYFYPDLLKKRGAVPEFKYPYDPTSVVWNEEDDIRTKLEQDLKISFFDMLDLQKYSYKSAAVYVPEAQAQDVEFIKNLLDKGHKAVAACYFVNGAYWSAHTGSQQSKISPWDFLQVKKDGKVLSEFERLISFDNWVEQAKKGEVDLVLKEPHYDIEAGHAVCIVGYDRSGFLIKNSWGTSWGDKGYGWVSFEYHKLFARELLYIIDNEVSGWNSKPDISYTSTDFELKSLPHVYTDAFTKKKTNCISLSVVYTGDKVPPRFESIVYKSFDANGVAVDTAYGNTHGIFDGFLSGYETYLQCVDAPFSRNIPRLIVEFTVSNGQKFTQVYENIIPLNQQYSAK